MARSADLSLAHPSARSDFEALAKRASGGLAAGSLRIPFLVFELYRSPQDQEEAFKRGASQARAYTSAHQFGLAIDLVPFVNGKWTWDPPGGTLAWDALDKLVAEFPNLSRPISWDRPHVEHVLWNKLRWDMK